MDFAVKTLRIRKFQLGAAVVLLGCVSLGAKAQQAKLSEVADNSSAAVSTSLPDAPSALLASTDGTSSSSLSSPSPQEGQQNTGVQNGQIVPPGEQIAPVHAVTIQAGWQAAPLTKRGKFMVGLDESYTWESLAGYVVAGAYSHVTNGPPNYGTNGAAFAQRVGAAALRGTSENLFADAVLASAFHEDPRYYIEGDKYSFGHRLFYAATRPLVTRSDSGHNRVNASLLLGYLAASALTTAYYPADNRNGANVARTYASSLGGAAAGYVWDEFIGDLVNTFRHRRQQQP